MTADSSPWEELEKIQLNEMHDTGEKLDREHIKNRCGMHGASRRKIPATVVKGPARREDAAMMRRRYFDNDTAMK